MKSILFSLFLSVSVYAHDDLEKIVTLSEDVRDVVVEVEDPPADFVLDEKTTDFIMSLQEMDHQIASLIPASLIGINDEKGPDQSEDPCEDQYEFSQELVDRIQGRKFQIYFTGTFSEGADLGLSTGFSGRENYNKFMKASARQGHDKASDIDTIHKLENRYKRENQPKHWGSLSTSERASILQDFALDYSGARPGLGLILSEYAIQGMIKNPEKWREELGEIKDKLSFEEKIKLASHFGGRFSDNYNYDRADGKGPRAKGIVTIEEMLDSVRTGTPGGVCRDVTQAQSDILMELGIKSSDIYQAAYSTATGGHVVMAIRDPDNPKKIIKMNYSYVEPTEGKAGGDALTQNSTLPDFGQEYRIYDAHGTPVARVPTEFGNIIKDVSGNRTTKDGISQTYNLGRVYVDTPIGMGTVFTGTTASGDNVVGVAVRKSNEGQGETFEYNVGVGYYQRDGDRASVTLDQKALHAHMKYTYNSPRKEVGPLSFGVSGGTGLDLLYMDNKQTYSWGPVTKGTNTEVKVGFHGGADVEYSSPDDRTKVTTGLFMDAYVDSKNEQEGSSGGMRPVVDAVTWTTTVERKVTSDMTLTGESAIVLRNIGNSALFKGTLEDTSRDAAASVFYQTPLSDDIPAFNPMSTEVVGIEARKSWNRPGKRVGSHFILDFRRDLDLNQNSANATFGIHF